MLGRALKADSSLLNQYMLLAAKIEASNMYRVWVNPQSAERCLKGAFGLGIQYSLQPRESKILCLVLQQVLSNFAQDELIALDFVFGFTGSKHRIEQLWELTGETTRYRALRPFKFGVRHLRHPIRSRSLYPFRRLLECGDMILEDQVESLVADCRHLLDTDFQHVDEMFINHIKATPDWGQILFQASKQVRLRQQGRRSRRDRSDSEF